MKHIKEIMDKMKTMPPIEFKFSFRRKSANCGYRITNQDKLHIRMITAIQLAKRNELQIVLDHEFTETWEYVKERETLVYTIRLKKEGRKKEYAHC